MTMFIVPPLDAVAGVGLDRIPRDKSELIAALSKPKNEQTIYAKDLVSYI